MTSITPEKTVTRSVAAKAAASIGQLWKLLFQVRLTSFSFKATDKKPMLIRQFAWWIQEQVRRFDEEAA